MRDRIYTATVSLDSGTYRVAFERWPAERDTGTPEGYELVSLTRDGERTELELDELCAAEAEAIGRAVTEAQAIDLLLEEVLADRAPCSCCGRWLSPSALARVGARAAWCESCRGKAEAQEALADRARLDEADLGALAVITPAWPSDEQIAEVCA